MRDNSNGVQFELSFKKHRTVQMKPYGKNVPIEGEAKMGYIEFADGTIWTKNYTDRMGSLKDKTPFLSNYMATKVKQKEIWSLLEQIKSEDRIDGRYLKTILFLWMKNFSEEFVEETMDPDEIDIAAFQDTFRELKQKLQPLIPVEGIDLQLFESFAPALLGAFEPPEKRRSSSQIQGASRFKVGMRVRGNYKGSGQWYDATIMEAAAGGKFLLKWDDNDPQDRLKSPDQLEIIVQLSVSKDVIMPVKSLMSPVLVAATTDAVEWSLESPFKGLYLMHGVLYGLADTQIPETAVTITMKSETDAIARLQVLAKTKEIAENIRYGRYNCVQFALGAQSGLFPEYENHPERWEIRPKLPDWFDLNPKTGELRFLGPSVEEKGKLEKFIITAITENVGSREVEVNIGANDKTLSGLWKCEMDTDNFLQLLLFMNDDLSFTGRVHLTGEAEHIEMPDTLRRLLDREEDFHGSAEIVEDVLTVRQPFFAELIGMNTIEMKSRSGKMVFSRSRYVDMTVNQKFVESTRLIISGVNPFGSSRWLVQLTSGSDTLWLNPLTGLLSTEKTDEFFFTREMWDNGIPLNVDFNASYTLQVIMEVHGEFFTSARSTIRSFQKPFHLGEIVDYANTPFWIRSMSGEGQKLELVPVYLSTTSPVSLWRPEVDVFKRWPENLNLNRYLVQDSMTCSEKSPFGNVVKILKVSGDDVLVKDEYANHKILAPWHLFPRDCEVPVGIRVLRKSSAGGEDHLLSIRRIRVLGKDMKTRYTLKSLDCALLCSSENKWIFSIPCIESRLTNPSNLENDMEFMSAHVPRCNQDRYLLPGAEILYDVEKSVAERKNVEFKFAVIKEKSENGYLVAVAGDDGNIHDIARDQILRITKFSESEPAKEESRRRDHLWVSLAVHGAWEIEDIGRVEIFSGSNPESMVGCSVQLLYENHVVHEFEITQKQAVYAFYTSQNLEDFIATHDFHSDVCSGKVDMADNFSDTEFKVNSDITHESMNLKLDGSAMEMAESEEDSQIVRVPISGKWNVKADGIKEEVEDELELKISGGNVYWDNCPLLDSVLYVEPTKYLTNGSEAVETDYNLDDLRTFFADTDVNLVVKTDYSVGDRVRGHYKNNHWYLSTVAEASEGTYVLNWDDGDTADREKEIAQLLPILELKEIEFFPGDRVECLYQSGWRQRERKPATVLAKLENGNYSIEWEDSYIREYDGDVLEKTADEMKLLKRGNFQSAQIYSLPEALANDGAFMKLSEEAAQKEFPKPSNLFQWAMDQTDIDVERAIHLTRNEFPKAAVTELMSLAKPTKVGALFGIRAKDRSSLLIYILKPGVHLFAQPDASRAVFQNTYAEIPVGLVACHRDAVVDIVAGHSFFKIIKSDSFVSAFDLMKNRSCWFYVNPELNRRQVKKFNVGTQVDWQGDGAGWSVKEVLGNGLVVIEANDNEKTVDLDELEFLNHTEIQYETVKGPDVPAVGISDAVLHGRPAVTTLEYNWNYFIIHTMNISNHMIALDTVHIMVQEECNVQLFMTPSSSDDKDDFNTWQPILIEKQYPISRTASGVKMCLHLQNSQLFSKIAIDIMVTTDTRTQIGEVNGEWSFNDSSFFAKGLYCGNQFEKDYGKFDHRKFPYFFLRYCTSQSTIFDPIQHICLIDDDEITQDKDFFQMIPWEEQKEDTDDKKENTNPDFSGRQESRQAKVTVSDTGRQISFQDGLDDSDITSNYLSSNRSPETRKAGASFAADFDRARIRSASRAMRRPSTEAMTPGFVESPNRKVNIEQAGASSVPLEDLWGGRDQWRFSPKTMLFEYKVSPIMETTDVQDIYTNLFKHFIESKKCVLDMKLLLASYDDDAGDDEYYNDFWRLTLQPIIRRFSKELQHKTIRLFVKAEDRRKLAQARKTVLHGAKSPVVEVEVVVPDEQISRWWFTNDIPDKTREFIQNNALNFYETEAFRFLPVEKDNGSTGQTTLKWARPPSWSIKNIEHPLQGGGCFVIENNQAEDIIVNSIHIIVAEPCEVKLFKSKRDAKAIDSDEMFSFAKSKKIDKCWVPVKLNLDTIIKTCGQRHFVILCSSPCILLNCNPASYYYPGDIVLDNVEVKMYGTVDKGEKDSFSIYSQYSRTGSGSLICQFSFSELKAELGDEGVVCSKKDDQEIQWIVDEGYLSLFNAFCKWEVGSKAEVKYGPDGKDYMTTVVKEEDNGMWSIQWDDGTRHDLVHPSIEFKDYDPNVVYSFQPINPSATDFMKRYGFEKQSWSELIPGCTNKKTWRQFYTCCRVHEHMGTDGASSCFEREQSKLGDDLKAAINEFKPPTKQQLDVYSKIHAVKRERFYSQRVRMISESGLGDSFVKVQIVGADMPIATADWPLGLITFKPKSTNDGKKLVSQMKIQFADYKDQIDIEVMALHLIDQGYGRKFVREFLKHEKPNSNFDSTLNPNFTGPVELEYLCNHIIRVKNIVGKSVEFDLILISKQGVEEQYLSDGTVRQRTEKNDPWLTKQSENRHMGEIIREQRRREDHFIQVRAKNGYRSHWQLLVTLPNDISPGEIVMVEKDGIPRTANVIAVNPNGTIRYSTFETQYPEVTEIDNIRRADINRFNIFHGGFENLLYRGCKQFMLEKRFDESSRIKVWDSTKNEVQTSIPHAEIQNYFIADYNGASEIYIMTNNSIQVYSTTDFTKPLMAHDVEFFGKEICVADRVLFTVDEDLHVIRFDMNEHNPRKRIIPNTDLPSEPSAILHIEIGSRELLAIAVQGVIRMVYMQGRNQIADDLSEERQTWSHPKYFHVHGIKRIGRFLFSGHQRGDSNLAITEDMLLRWDLVSNRILFQGLYGEEVFDLEVIETGPGENLLMSGHHRHVMVWGEEGEKLERINFFQTIDSISYCAESQSLIAGNETGYVEQILFTGGTIKVIELDNVSSICNQEDQKLMCCLTSSHLVLCDLDSRERGKSLSIIHENGSISNFKRDYICLWNGKKAVLFQIRDQGLVRVGTSKVPRGHEFISRNLHGTIFYSKKFICLGHFVFGQDSLSVVDKKFYFPNMKTCKMSQNGKFLVATTETFINVWEISSGRTLISMPTAFDPSLFCVSSSGDFVFIISSGNEFHKLDVKKRKFEPKVFKVEDEIQDGLSILQLDATWNGHYIFGFTNDDRVVIWDERTAERVFCVFCDSQIKSMHLSTYHCVINQNNGQIWVLDTGRLSWDVKYQGRLMSFSMVMKDYDVHHFTSILNLSDTYQCWKQRCVIERLIMADEFDLMEQLFERAPEVAIQQNLISLANSYQKERCLEALLDAIIKAYRHKNLQNPELDITREIVRAALTFPDQVKDFFNDLPLVELDQVNGYLPKSKRKGSPNPKLDPAEPIWTIGKDYVPDTTFISKNRLPIRNCCTLDTIRFLLKANDPELFDNLCMRHSLGYLWSRLKWTFFKETIAYFLFLGLWFWFTDKAVLTLVNEEDESEFQKLQDQDDPEVLAVVVLILILTFYFLFNEGLQLWGSISEAFELKEEDDKHKEVPVSKLKLHRVVVNLKSGHDKLTTLEVVETWNFDNKLTRDGDLQIEHEERSEPREVPLQRPISRQFTTDPLEESQFQTHDTSPFIDLPSHVSSDQLSAPAGTKKASRNESAIEMINLNPRAGVLTTWEGGGEVIFETNAVGWMVNFEARIGSVYATQPLMSGRIYFEICVVDIPKFFRVGWIALPTEYKLVPSLGSGKEEWAFDGYLAEKIHDSDTGPEFGRPLVDGDILGVLVEIEKGEMKISLNGEEFMEMFTDCDFVRSDSRNPGIVPAVSGIDGIVLWVFDDENLKYKPPGEDIGNLRIMNEFSVSRLESGDHVSSVDILRRPSVADVALERSSSLQVDSSEAHKRRRAQKPLREYIPGYTLIMGLYNYLWGWNLVDLTVFISVLITFKHWRDRDRKMLAVWAAFTTLAAFLNTLYYSRGIKESSVVVRILLAIMVEIKYFLAIVVIVVLGFSIAFRWLGSAQEASESFGSIWDSFVNTFAMGILGDTEPLEEIRGDFQDPVNNWGEAIFILMDFLLLILMLNAVIAYMGDSYNKVRVVSEAWSLNQRASLLMEFMGNMPVSKRKQLEHDSQWLHMLGFLKSKKQKKEISQQLEELQADVMGAHEKQQRWFRSMETMVQDLRQEIKSLKSSQIPGSI